MLPRALRRLAVAPLAVLALLTVAGCGTPHSTETHALTEGTYLTIGPLTYQVQVSRVLNPKDVEDQSYLVGLPAGTRPLARDETWFAVFVRVDNERSHSYASPPLANFRIVDSAGVAYAPTALSTVNVFAYAPQLLAPNDVSPDPTSAAGQGPIKGTMLLFRIRTDSLYNRPVQLRFSAGGKQGTVDLDV